MLASQMWAHPAQLHIFTLREFSAPRREVAGLGHREKGTLLPGEPECPLYTNSSEGIGVKVMSQETSSHTKAGKVPELKQTGGPGPREQPRGHL